MSGQIILGLAYLAANLRKFGHEVKIIDATAPYKQGTAKQIKDFIGDFKPDFIGITLTIDNIFQTYSFLRDLREINIPIVAGGPHANGLPEEVLKNGADIVAIGEGEETIVEITEYFLGRRALGSIDGICFFNADREITFTNKRRPIADLDSLPFPDFNDFPIRNYTGVDDVNSNPIFWSIVTSRGCPFDCLFCSSNKMFGRQVRMRSAENVFEEIKLLADTFSVRHIAFQDDEVLCSKERFIRLCDLISRSKLNIRISMRTRIDSIDKDILSRAKEAGITRMSFGIESWDNDTLKKIRKNYTVERILEKFKIIEETGFPFVSFNNICGFPWETEEHFSSCLAAISRIPRRIKYFTSLVTPVPYPKTELYELYHKEFRFTDWWLSDQGNFRLPEKPPFFLKLFAHPMHPLYIKPKFWNYDKSIERSMVKFGWRLLWLVFSRHYKFPLNLVIFSVCIISYSLWKVSPGIEQRLFKFLLCKKVFDLRERLNFVSKY
ncbi:MAG: radical SAM protein [Candidatus Omnitrophica bacterium]|nr:radical SAM protein [Candidatus Omnitrophota bacterium]